jgi:hypothetical protein
MRVQLLLLREPLGVSDALATDPKVGTIDPEFGQMVTYKHATQIGLNRFEVTIWHEGDDDKIATDLDDVHPFFAATVVSACLLFVLAVIVALVNLFKPIEGGERHEDITHTPPTN